MTSAIDTYVLGHCRTQVDSGSAPRQAKDGAGHFGRALQASVQVRQIGLRSLGQRSRRNALELISLPSTSIMYWSR